MYKMNTHEIFAYPIGQENEEVVLDKPPSYSQSTKEAFGDNKCPHCEKLFPSQKGAKNHATFCEILHNRAMKDSNTNNRQLDNKERGTFYIIMISCLTKLYEVNLRKLLGVLEGK